LARNSGKAEIVDRLLEHADRTLQIEKLLTVAKEHNPARYEKHQPYYDTITGLSISSDVSRESQRAEAKKDNIWGIPQVWWVPIVVASIGLIGVIIPLITNTAAEKTSPSPQQEAVFEYPVRVQAKGTGENISNAKVTIEVIGKAPLDEFTDANGFIRIFIGADRAGQPAKLIVEARGYKQYIQNIDLTQGNLPDVVQLEPAATDVDEAQIRKYDLEIAFRFKALINHMAELEQGSGNIFYNYSIVTEPNFYESQSEELNGKPVSTLLFELAYLVPSDQKNEITAAHNAVIELEQLGAKFGAKAQAMLADGEVSADEEATYQQNIDEATEALRKFLQTHETTFQRWLTLSIK
jgi:hypothetical protein